jgi:pilus assembly protein Flp/PilA
MLCVNAGQGLRRFCTNESGATAIEYAILAVGISVVIIATVTAIGTSVKNSFTSVSAGFN